MRETSPSRFYKEIFQGKIPKRDAKTIGVAMWGYGD